MGNAFLKREFHQFFRRRGHILEPLTERNDCEAHDAVITEIQKVAKALDNWALRGLSSFEEELASYSEFWRNKITHNVERDRDVTAKLESSGWIVIRIWESEIRKDVDRCVDRIINIRETRRGQSQK